MTASVSGRVGLLPNPQSTGSPAAEIEIDVARHASALALTYIVRGDIAAVAVPKQTKPARADGLWQHTCFEAFVRSAHSQAYWEFNLSPSRQWAAYRFDGYRRGMAAEPALTDPQFEIRLEASELRLSTKLDLSGIEALATGKDWQVGLSAVIEEQDGRKSYWALAHPPGKPDFHHANSFALRLPPTA